MCELAACIKELVQWVCRTTITSWSRFICSSCLGKHSSESPSPTVLLVTMYTFHVFTSVLERSSKRLPMSLPAIHTDEGHVGATSRRVKSKTLVIKVTLSTTFILTFEEFKTVIV